MGSGFSTRAMHTPYIAGTAPAAICGRDDDELDAIGRVFFGDGGVVIGQEFTFADRRHDDGNRRQAG
jgi:hypothetical protein